MEKKVIKKSKIAKDVTKEKKHVSKKRSITKEKVKEEKRVVPEEEPTSVKIKRFIGSYQFLYSLFAVLLIVVVVLLIMIGNKENKQNINKSDIVFSILEKNTNSDFSIDLKGLVGRKYALKVTNYRNETMCEEEIPYKIHVINNSKAKIEILKDGGADNLMVDQEETIIEAPALGCSKKTETIYYFNVLSSSEVKDKDTLKIEVIS